MIKTANVTPEITLSSGRVIAHERMENGAQMATPTTGPVEMTESEWAEYVSIINPKGK
jgi:hypothetical protein